MTNQKHAMPNRNPMTKNSRAMTNSPSSIPNQTLLMTKITYCMTNQKHAMTNLFDTLNKKLFSPPTIVDVLNSFSFHRYSFHT